MSPSGAPGQTPPVPPDESQARRSRFGRRRLLALSLVILAAFVAIGVVVATRDSSPPLDEAQARTIASGVVKKAIEDLQSQPATSAVVYQQILPSLVEIEAEHPAGAKDGTGLGTGVIVNARGSILTALHVVDGADSIRVVLRRRHEVGGHGRRRPIPSNDIAVLAPERGPEVIVPAVLGGGGQVGDEAYAVGHPLGYVGSLTSGVISGLDRSDQARRRQDAARPDPVRRGRQPRQLRRAAAQPRAVR